jgi:hypothetical protein
LFTQENVEVAVQLVSGVWAGCDTCPTRDTPIREILDLWSRMSSLRIMAPETAESASFQKNGRSNARAIVNGKALNMKDSTRGAHEKCLLREES